MNQKENDYFEDAYNTKYLDMSNNVTSLSTVVLCPSIIFDILHSLSYVAVEIQEATRSSTHGFLEMFYMLGVKLKAQAGALPTSRETTFDPL